MSKELFLSLISQNSSPCLNHMLIPESAQEHLIQILKDELETAMRLSGITDVDQAHPGLVNTRDIDYLVPETDGHAWVKWQPRAKI